MRQLSKTIHKALPYLLAPALAVALAPVGASADADPDPAAAEDERYEADETLTVIDTRLSDEPVDALRLPANVTVGVVKAVQSDLGPRHVVERPHELGMTVEAHPARRVTCRPEHAFAQPRDTGSQRPARHQLQRSPVGRHEESDPEPGTTLQQTRHPPQGAACEVPTRFVGVVRSRRVDVVDAEADRRAAPRGQPIGRAGHGHGESVARATRSSNATRPAAARRRPGRHRFPGAVRRGAG